MDTDPNKLMKIHQKLNHSENKIVISHTQREKNGWFINSIMIDGCDVPFKFKRKSRCKILSKSQRVNLTYYAQTENIAGLEFETMKVVRIKRA